MAFVVHSIVLSVKFICVTKSASNQSQNAVDLVPRPTVVQTFIQTIDFYFITEFSEPLVSQRHNSKTILSIFTFFSLFLNSVFSKFYFF